MSEHRSSRFDLANAIEVLERTLRGWRLTDRELALEGEHPALGRVTLAQLLATWVVHDLGHLAQTSRVMAKQWREEVGPWRAYLPIVDR
jgi:hypothetical protein